MGVRTYIETKRNISLIRVLYWHIHNIHVVTTLYSPCRCTTFLPVNHHSSYIVLYIHFTNRQFKYEVLGKAFNQQYAPTNRPITHSTIQLYVHHFTYLYAYRSQDEYKQNVYTKINFPNTYICTYMCSMCMYVGMFMQYQCMLFLYYNKCEF